MLLDLLPLRSGQVYDKLADVLHVSGHALLADFLREEGNVGVVVVMRWRW